MNIDANHIKNYFSNLSFKEDTHTYSLEGKALKGSVSSLIKDFYEPFAVEDAVAKTMSRTGKTKEAILEDWKVINKESTDRGHRVHLFGERYPYNKTLIPSCPQEEGIKKFWDELPEWIILVGVELQMYHKEYFFPGTHDLLLYDTKRNGYIIADYKSNKDLFKNYQQKRMLAPFSDLLDSPFNHYQIQLSLYQILLEQIGIQVIERIIIHVDLEGNYIMYSTTDYKSRLLEYLKLKYKNLC